MTIPPTPPRDGDDVDAAFADIVAHWDDAPYERPDAAGRGHVNPSPAGPLADKPLSEATRSAVPRPDPIESGWRAYEPPEDDEVFVPPAPAPLPEVRREPWFWVSLIGMTVGGLGLLLMAVLDSSRHERLMTTFAVMFAVGFFVLVWRKSSRSEQRDKEGWEDDSGAEL